MSTANPLPVSDPVVVQGIVVLRYLTVSVYVVLLLEHFASFPQEVEFIWKAPRNLARICFLFYRYSTIFGLAILMYLLPGPPGSSDEKLFVFLCKRALSTLAALSVLTMGIADALVMLRVSVLWGRQRCILTILLLSFLITFSTAVICIAIVARGLTAHVVVAPKADDCHFTGRPNAIFGVWVPGMVFDLLVLSLTAFNACARPRTQEAALTTALYRDGIVVFLVLAGLRAINLFLSIFSRVFLIGVCIVWPLSAITLSRFIFGLHSLEKDKSLTAHSSRFDFEDADTESKPCSTLGGSTRSQGTANLREHNRNGFPWRNDNPRPPLQQQESDQCQVT